MNLLDNFKITKVHGEDELYECKCTINIAVRFTPQPNYEEALLNAKLKVLDHVYYDIQPHVQKCITAISTRDLRLAIAELRKIEELITKVN